MSMVDKKIILKHLNVLVHDYVDIDTQKLHKYVVTGLDDFKKFAKYIATYLAK